LNDGADPNARDGDEITPLMHAARGERPDYDNPAPTDHPEVVELLIRQGADVNARTSTGFVALFWAAKYGHVNVVWVLLVHGVDPNVKDDYGETALAGATRWKHTEVINLLRQAGAKD
jgi:ankyrin repeat protein